MAERPDGRTPQDLRPVTMTRGFLKYAEGSCLIQVGDTKVICSASVEDRVPPFLKGSGSGWVTAEYSMIPRSCKTRNQRDTNKPNGRSMEIQRLVGRALRSIVNLKGFGERTIWIDCDVIQADGGTRTAAITGSYVALVEAMDWLKKSGVVRQLPLYDLVAAISVGIVNDREVLDLAYEEDSIAAVDMNVVMTGNKRLVEVQGTAEGMPFSRDTMNRMMDLAERGITQLMEIQKQTLVDVLGL
ncbi:MAG TPA: ribonuclease PH [Armatimonadota bacterium]